MVFKAANPHDLLQHMQSLNYSEVVDGICAGVIEMWVQDCLADQEHQFLRRLYILSNLSSEQFEAELTRARSKESLHEPLEPIDHLILDSAAMLDGIKFFLSAGKDVLTMSNLRQQQPERLSHYIASLALESRGGRIQVLSQIFINDQVKIAAYFENLRSVYRQSGINPRHAPITFASIDHRIGIRYDERRDAWFVLDPREEPKLVGRNSIASFLMQLAEEPDICAFRIQIQMSVAGFDIHFVTKLHKLHLKRRPSKQQARLVSNQDVTLALLAAKYNDVKTLQSIIHTQGIIDMPFKGDTPLLLAVQLSHAKCVELLCAQARINPDVLPKDKLPLKLIAIANNNMRILHALLGQPTHPKYTERIKNAVYFACICDKLDILKELIKLDANVIYQTYANGLTSLTAAAAYTSARVLNFLLHDMKFDPDIADNTHTLAIERAILHDVNPESIACLSLLLNAKTNLNVITSDQSTPLITTIKQLKEAFMQLLITHGADVNQVDKHGEAPITIAAKNNLFDCVFYLITHGANVNAVNHYQMSALHYAARFNDTIALATLIQHGANFNQQDKSGNTPAHIAAKHGYGLIAELVNAGADFFIANLLGNTAFGLCVNFEHWDAITMILLATENDALLISNKEEKILIDHQDDIFKELVKIIEQIPDDTEKKNCLDHILAGNNIFSVIFSIKNQATSSLLFSAKSYSHRDYQFELRLHFQKLLSTPAP